jgi:hypothetical protein
VENLDRQGNPVHANSIVMLMTMGVSQGHLIWITAEGPDEEAIGQCPKSANRRRDDDSSARSRWPVGVEIQRDARDREALRQWAGQD